MRKLAQELNAQAPSLYSYYRTKEELLNDVVDRITANIDVSGFKDGDWKRGLIVWARSYRDALAAHPNMVAFIASGPGRREEALRRADAIHGGLVSAGWPARLATMIGASPATSWWAPRSTPCPRLRRRRPRLPGPLPQPVPGAPSAGTRR